MGLCINDVNLLKYTTTRQKYRANLWVADGCVFSPVRAYNLMQLNKGSEIHISSSLQVLLRYDKLHMALFKLDLHLFSAHLSRSTKICNISDQVSAAR